MRPFIPSTLDDAGLDLASFRVFAHLCRCADNEDGIAYPAYDAIGEKCGVSRATVCRSIRKLVEARLIEKLPKRFGGSNRYRVLPVVSGEERMDASNSLVRDTKGASIVSPEARLEPNRLASDTIAPPIVSPENRNRVSGEASIVSPEAREGYPTKGIQQKEERIPEEVAFWNSFDVLPRVRICSETRKKKLRARRNGPDWSENWRLAIEKLASSSFATGSNDRGWKADFDFFLQPESLAKIIEGKYDNRQGSKPLGRRDYNIPQTV